MTTFVALGPHIIDVLGRPVTEIPPGQGSARLTELAVTVAGTAGGTAVDLARLGGTVRSVGAIGDDPLGRFLRFRLDEIGVDGTGLIEIPGLPTSGTILPIRPNGERPALHLPGATSHLTSAMVGFELVDGADYLHVGGPDVLGDYTTNGLVALLARARSAGTVISADLLSIVGADTLELLADVFAEVDHLLINDQQAAGLTGIADAVEAAAALHAHGVPHVVVTRGADGGVLVDADGSWTFPALPVDVIDTTGCGDAFSAGYLFGLSLGRSPRSACGLGTCCAASVARVLGSDGIVDLATASALLPADWPAASA